MAERGRPKAALELTADERATLQRWARRPKSLQALALRSRIVLACADGLPNTAVAEQLGVNKVTVGKWRARFVEHRLDGLSDEPRPGAPRTVTDDLVEAVIVKTLESQPANATHWSTRSTAAATGMSQSAVSRIWRAFGLKPHKQAQTGSLQAVHRSAVRGEGPRRGRALSRPPRKGAGVVCR
jgi:transposase